MKAILSFHSIDDEGTVLSFSPANLVLLLEGLRARDIPVLDLSTLLRPDVEQGVALTFDDGMVSVFETAMPIMMDYDATAHLFLTGSAVGRTNRWPGQPNNAPDYQMMDWNQLTQLADCGFLIDAHTYSHPDLRSLSDAEMGDEFSRCDDLIESRLGRRPEFFAYPYGFVDDRTARVAGKYYAGCVTTRLGYLGNDEDHTRLPRLDSYYLNRAPLVRDIFSGKTRYYLAARGVLRGIRGMVWNADHA